MNKTQKSAWIILWAVMLDAFGAIYVGLIIALRSWPPRPLGQAMMAFAALASLALIVAVILAMARHQSSSEPESDERDDMIKRRSILFSFVGGWLLQALVLLVLALTLGETGSVPVYLLTVLGYGVFLITLLIYAAATLLQYGRGVKDER